MGQNYAIDYDGNIWAWGNNAYGALGIAPASEYRATPTKLNIPSAAKIVDIAAGDYYTHALDANGDIWYAGWGLSGRLGDGQLAGINTSYQKMVKPSGMGKVTDITTGVTTSVAIDDAGNTWEWGMLRGRTAINSLSYQATPKKVVFNASEIAKYGYTPIPTKSFAGESVSHIIDQNGRIWSWGNGTTYGFGIDGAYESDLLTWSGEAKVFLKTMGDGDTQYQNSAPKTPSYLDITTTKAGSLRNNYGGYSFGSDGLNLHPTIYDEKYMAKDDAGYVLDEDGNRLKYVSHSRNVGVNGSELGFYYILDSNNNTTSQRAVPAINKKEKLWIDLAGKELAYTTFIATSRESYTTLDADGNLYKWGVTGSGTMSWGWDVQSPKYDYYPAVPERQGLFDRYTYEIMYQRGAPTVDPVVVNLKRTNTKIYKNDDNTQKDTITVSAELPAAFNDPNMGIRISSELQEVKYVVVPYDSNNPDFNLDEDTMTKEQFLSLYSNPNYKIGSLLDTSIDGGDTGTTWENTIDINDNSRTYVMTIDRAYGLVTENFRAYTADNFYTPTVLKHQGIAELNLTNTLKLYEATTENVEKQKSGTDTSDTYGISLDASGEAISSPSFGYDKVTVSKYDTLPNGENPYWNFKSGQESTPVFTLDDMKYEASKNYTHTFLYERNMANWVEVSYASEEKGTTNPVPGFVMPGENPELIKKGVSLSKAVPEVAGYVSVGYRLNNDLTIYDLTSGGLNFTPTANTLVTFVYELEREEVTGEKSAGSTVLATGGETIDYTISYTNTGNVPLSNLMIKDMLDDAEFEGTIVENLAINGMANSGNIIQGVTIPNLAVGDTVYVTFKVTLAASLPTGDGILQNTALAISEKGEEFEAGTTVPTDAASKLSGEKTITAESGTEAGIAEAGETLSYAISYTNTGNLDAIDVIITDTLMDTEFGGVDPTNVSVIGGTTNTGTLKTGINVGTVAVGATVTVTFDVTLPTPLPAGNGVLKNTATVTNPDPEEPAEIEVPTTAAPKLSGEKTITAESGAEAGIAEAGETLSYAISYTNTGNLDATDVIITDTLMDTEFGGVDPTNVTVIGGTTNTGTLKTGINVGTVAAGETVTVTFDVTLPSPLPAGNGILKNTATVTDPDPDKPGEIEVPTEAAPELDGRKDVLDNNKNGRAESGEGLVYTITYTNTGNLATTDDIIIVDTLDDTEFLGAVVSDLMVDGVTNTGDITTGINVGKLEAGQTVTVTFTITLANPLPAGDGILKNIATVNDIPLEKEIPTNATSELIGTKEVADESANGEAEAGEKLSYTITFENIGDLATSTDVIVRDTLDDTEFVGSTITNLMVNGVINAGDITAGINTGILAPGESVVVTFDVTLANPLPTGDGILKNIATANDKETEVTIPLANPLTKLVVKKVDNISNATLQGAEFDVLDENKNIIASIATDVNGIATVNSLEAGTYYLRETKAPASYVLLAADIKVVISENQGEILELEVANEKVKAKDVPTIAKTINKVSSIDVYNQTDTFTYNMIVTMPETVNDSSLLKTVEITDNMNDYLTVSNYTLKERVSTDEADDIVIEDANITITGKQEAVKLPVDADGTYKSRAGKTYVLEATATVNATADEADAYLDANPLGIENIANVSYTDMNDVTTTIDSNVVYVKPYYGTSDVIKTVDGQEKVTLDKRSQTFVYEANFYFKSDMYAWDKIVLEDFIDDNIQVIDATWEDGAGNSFNQPFSETYTHQALTYEVPKGDDGTYNYLKNKSYKLVVTAVLKDTLRDKDINDIIAREGLTSLAEINNGLEGANEHKQIVSNIVHVIPPTPLKPEQPVKTVDIINETINNIKKQIFNYNVKYTLPSDTTHWQKLEFIDVLNANLEVISTSVTDEVGNVVEGVTTITGQEVKVTMPKVNGSYEYLQNKTYTLSIKAKLKDSLTDDDIKKIIEDGGISNTAFLDYGDDPVYSNTVSIVPETPKTPVTPELPVTGENEVMELMGLGVLTLGLGALFIKKARRMSEK